MRHLEIIAQKQNVHRGQSRPYYINKDKERRLEGLGSTKIISFSNAQTTKKSFNITLPNLGWPTFDDNFKSPQGSNKT
jgi:hypothetical protein